MQKTIKDALNFFSQQSHKKRYNRVTQSELKDQ